MSTIRHQKLTGQLTVASCMKNSNLEDNKRRCDIVFDLNFNCVGLVLWDGGHGEEVRGPNEKVSMERSHP